VTGSALVSSRRFLFHEASRFLCNANVLAPTACGDVSQVSIPFSIHIDPEQVYGWRLLPKDPCECAPSTFPRGKVHIQKTSITFIDDILAVFQVINVHELCCLIS
jgi:hypothetical protein